MLKIDEAGNKFWFLEGTNIPHRLDGPAIEYANGTKYWYLEGKLYSKEQWEYELLLPEEKLIKNLIE